MALGTYSSGLGVARCCGEFAWRFYAAVELWDALLLLTERNGN